MQADIVDRLRDEDYRNEMQHLRDWRELDALHDDAAAYIERLRKDRDLLREALDAANRRADDARAMAIEEATQVAAGSLGGYLCPYGRDKPGDPTWGHTDADKCPVCGCNGETSLHGCHDTVQGRLASAIRALQSRET